MNQSLDSTDSSVVVANKPIGFWRKIYASIFVPKQIDPQKRIRSMTLLAIIIALEIAMAFIPNVGYIVIPPIALTLMLVPVTIVCVVFNFFYGFVAGLVFGITSLIQAFLQPVGLNILFQNPLVSIVPRAIAPFFIRGFYLFFRWCFHALKDLKWSLLTCWLTAICAVIIHAILVSLFLFGIYYPKVSSTANAKNVFAIFSVLIAVNMGVDAAIGPIITAPCCYLLLRALSYQYFYNLYFKPNKQ